MGNVSFKSYYGKDVQEGISMTEQKQLTANNLFGNGYRNGERTSVGCSVKGRFGVIQEVIYLNIRNGQE